MMVVFVGPKPKFTAHGLTFVRGEPRPVPPAVARQLQGHPWFEVVPVETEDAQPVPAKRGRPRKTDGNG
jgi:hypothetical protein